MKKRDISILIALGVVVFLVAWWFLIIGPKKDETAQKEKDYEAARQSYDQNRVRVQRIDEERSAARQATADLLKLSKLIPADSQVPSMIIELQSTANDAGIKFLKIVPNTAVAGTEGGTIVPFELNFQGQYYDVNDFLYRVENFARMEGNDISVGGRLISIVSLEMSEPNMGEFPDVLVKLGANAYMTSPAPASRATGKATDTGAAGEAGGAGG